MKNRIKLDMNEYEEKRPERPVRSSISEQEKIAKLYALAKKLHVKIGGDADGRS
jgi:hypothetical protein